MSVDELFKAIDDLRETDLENLMCRARAARTRLNPSILSEQETTLLLKINHALPEELHQEFITLRDRRDADIIIDTEYEQLAEVSDRIEELTTDRCFHTPIGCTGFPGWEDSSNNSRCDRRFSSPPPQYRGNPAVRKFRSSVRTVSPSNVPSLNAATYLTPPVPGLDHRKPPSWIDRYPKPETV